MKKRAYMARFFFVCFSSHAEAFRSPATVRSQAITASLEVACLMFFLSCLKSMEALCTLALRHL
jgi:hypothetical protein